MSLSSLLPADLIQVSRPLEWIVLAAMLAAGLEALWLIGRAGAPSTGGPAWRRLALRLESGFGRVFGMPGWAAAGAGFGFWALLTAFLGFMWDVSWHADVGRDRELMTVAHSLILTGLMGMALAAAVTVVLASVAGAPVRLHRGALRIPAGAVALGVLAGGALTAFPLDDYWHALYGIDVTMWSPTHLLMIGAASLTPIAVWMLLAEGGAGVTAGTRAGRFLVAGMGGTVLVGLSTFQLEYDLGIPQWQLLFQPELLAAAAGMALVAARVVLGRWGALRAVAGFIVLRLLLLAFVGGLLGLSAARIPLYLGEALCVELAFRLFEKRSLTLAALAAGALAGSVGLAVEGAWVSATMSHPWTPALYPYLPAAFVIAVAAAVVGAGMGAAVARRSGGPRRLLVVPALVVIGVLLAWHVPARTTVPASAALRATPAGTTWHSRDRAGDPVSGPEVQLSVTLSPADAAAGADWFEVTAWQGGYLVHVPLVAEGGGVYHAAAPIPVDGGWKSMVFIGRGDVQSAVPVEMPADATYRLPAIPAPDGETRPFVPARTLLMREGAGSSGLPATVITAFFILMVIAWVAVLAAGFARVAVPGDRPPARRGEPARQPDAPRSRAARPAI